MRNIRLYIGGQRADLDSSTNIPFTYQTSDAEMPTAVKNSYSKTVTLQGTETNRRLFGGLWHLDSMVQEAPPPRAPEYVAIDTESDAQFIERATPVIATGDRLKVTKVKGRSVVWNQAAINGKFFGGADNWTRSTSHAPITVANNILTMDVNASTRGALAFRNMEFPASHVIYYSMKLKVLAATNRTFNSFYVYPSPYQYLPTTALNTDDCTDWKKVSGTFTTNGVKTRIYFGFYGTAASQTLAAGDKVQLQDCMAIDLTAYFGAGSEPTAAEWEAMMPLDFYVGRGMMLTSNGATSLETRTAGNTLLDSLSLNIPILTSSGVSRTLTYNQGFNNASPVSYSYDNSGGGSAVTRTITASTFQSVASHKYYVRANYTGTSGVRVYMGNLTSAVEDLNGQDKILTSNSTRTTYISLYAIVPAGVSLTCTTQPIVVDLTAMYGAGNEPNILEFRTAFPGTFLEYSAGESRTYNTVFPFGLRSAGSVYDEISGDTAIVRIGDRAYASGDESDATVITDKVRTYYALTTPQTYTLDTPLSDTAIESEPSGYQVRIPVNTSDFVLAPYRGDFEYGYMRTYPIDEGVYFNPMKRVPFLLYVDEMVVERGYCQLTAINRKGRDYTFSLSLFGGLGEFFYNLQTRDDGETMKLSDLDWNEDLSFQINAGYVQQNWDDLLGGTLPTVAFVPMHNGVPKTIDANKMLIASGGGIPASITDGGDTYTVKDGYLLASCERKYTEWEVNDLRSYLQRPAIRLKSFISACILPANNGGWSVDLDSAFFANTNPYYENAYILLPQLNVEESTDDICDDGSVDPTSDYPSTVTRTTSLDLSSGGCMTIVSDTVDMSATASNAYLNVSVPVQLAVTGLTNQGDLYLTNRVSHHTENKTICMMLGAWDDDGNLLAVSNRYVFTSKSHRDETGDVKKPAAPYATSDAQIDGYFTWTGTEYHFRLDENSADTFALQIEKIPRPNSTLKHVRLDFYLQMTTAGIPTLNKKRKGENSSNVNVTNTQFDARILSGANNYIKLIQPTQYASDSVVAQDALLNSLETSPLELLLSITKTFGLMWVQDNQEKTVRLMQRPTYYTGEIRDIHDKVDYSKGLKVTPVAAESNNYILKNEYKETNLSQAYESDYGRTYGDVRLKVGYDFGKEKVELMEKIKLKGYVDGALSGAGYWKYRNANGDLPSAIAEGIKVTYYRDSGGQTYTKDVQYNLFNVTAITKLNSLPLGVACLSDDGEEKGVDVAPALVFFTGSQASGTYHLSDDAPAMANLNGGPCWIYDEGRGAARVPKFARVATFSGETYSLDFGTPRMTYYIPEVSLAPEQAIYSRFWERYLTDLLSENTKKVECYVVFPPHLDMREEMRKFYLFDRCLWVLNKVTDYDATKAQSVKCEFIRVQLRDDYLKY